MTQLEPNGAAPALVFDRGTGAVLAANDAAVSASGYARADLLALARERLITNGTDGGAFCALQRGDGTQTEIEIVARLALPYEEQPAELIVFRELLDPVTRLPDRNAFLHGDGPDGTSTLLLLRIVWTARSTQRDRAARDGAAVAAAQVIAHIMPSGATLSRYGENAFAIRLPGGRARNAQTLAKRLLAAFERPLVAGGEEIGGTASIGIAAGGSDVSAQVRDAEAALEDAAAAGTGYALFDAAIASAHDRHATIERSLRHAALDSSVGVVYQPIVSLRTAEVVGAEALMRWDCPGLGAVPPSEFIAIAEESRVILRLGESVLREACAQNRRWQLAGLRPIRMSVNVSRRQVAQADFMRVVHTTLESTSLAPEHLEIELAGEAAATLGDVSRRGIEALRRLGVRIAVDDFGTGYSSLRALGTLPVDTLKLDRPFVQGLGTDAFATEAARVIVHLAHLRGLRVVGIGVETAEQVAALRALDCDEAQGFLLGAPSSAETFAARLERDRMRAYIGPESA